MLTWMDRMVHAVAQLPEAKAMAEGKRFRSDIQVANNYFRLSPAIFDNEPVPDDETFDPDRYQFKRMMCFVAPVACSLIEDPDASILNVQITMDLLRDFLGAKAPDTEDWRKVFDQENIFYVDLPRFATVDPSKRVPAAIIAYKLTREIMGYFDLPDGVKPGDIYAVGVLRSLTEEFDLNKHLLVQFVIGKDGIRQATTRASAGSDTIAKFQASAEMFTTLLKLSALYHLSHEAVRETLPRCAPDQLKTFHPKQQGERLQSRSLFRVEQLSAPPGNFGRSADEHDARTDWTLGVRFRVRGHFRWQPYGPGRELRRLQWIASYEKGPQDGHAIHALHVQTPIPKPAEKP